MFSQALQDKTRRDFLKLSAGGVFGASLSGWLGVLANHAAAATPATKHKSCILLWADGGASHKDTLDLKPGTKDGGEFKPIPSPEEALAYPYTEAERAIAAKHRSLVFVGTAEEVRDKIERAAQESGADEVIVTSTVHAHAERLKGYELLVA